MKLSNNVLKVLELCDDYGFTIVSFGLAPRPNGFCFEMPDDGDEDTVLAAVELTKELNALSSKEEEELRTFVFGERG